MNLRHQNSRLRQSRKQNEGTAWNIQ